MRKQKKPRGKFDPTIKLFLALFAAMLFAKTIGNDR